MSSSGPSGTTLAAIAIVVVVIVVVCLIIAADAANKPPTPTPIPPINPITPVKTPVFTTAPSKPVPAKSAQAIFTSKPSFYDSKYAPPLPVVTGTPSTPAVSNSELAAAYNGTYAFLLNNTQRMLSSILGSSSLTFSHNMTTQIANPSCTVNFVFSTPKEIAQVQVYHVNMSQLQNNRLLVFLTIGWPQLTIPVNYSSNCGAQGSTSIIVPNVQINMSFVATMSAMCSASNITLSQFALNYIDMLTDLPPNAGITITVMGQRVVVPVEIIPALQMYVGSIAKELNNIPPQTLHLIGSSNACTIITSLLANEGAYVVKPPNGFLFNSDLGPMPESGSKQIVAAPACFASCRQSNTCGAALSNGSQCILYPYSADGSTPFIAQIASNDSTPIVSQWLYNGRGLLPTKSSSVMVLADGKYSLDITYDYTNQAILSAGGTSGQFLTVNSDHKSISWKSTADPVYSRGWIITSRYGLPVVLSTTNSSATQQSSCTVEFNGIAISLFGRLRLEAGNMILNTTGNGDPSTIYVKSN